MTNRRVNASRSIIGWLSILVIALGLLVIPISYLKPENLAFDRTAFGTAVAIISLGVAGAALWIAMKSDEQMKALANLEFDEKVVAMENYLDEFSNPMFTANDLEPEYKKILWDLRAMTHIAKWADEKRRVEAKQRLQRIVDHLVGKMDDTRLDEVKRLRDRIWFD